MDMLKYEKVFASLGETELADSPGLGLKSPSEYPRVPENVQKPLQIESVHNEENAQQPFLAPIPYMLHVPVGWASPKSNKLNFGTTTW